MVVSSAIINLTDDDVMHVDGGQVTETVTSSSWTDVVSK